MSLTTSVLGLIIIFLIFYFVSEYFFKRRLNIKSKRKGLFSKNRNKVFLVIEGTLIITLLIFYLVFLRNNLDELGIFGHIHLFVYFFLLYFFRGLEEWIKNKSEKSYYHDWLGSITFLIMFIFLWIGEMVNI